MTLRTRRPPLYQLYQSTSLRPFSIDKPMKSHEAPSEDLKSLKWREEQLTSTIDDRGGFYPALVCHYASGKAWMEVDFRVYGWQETASVC